MTDYAEGKPVADPLPKGASTESKQDSLIKDVEEVVRALVFGRDGSGKLLVSSRQNQWEGRFFEHDPNDVLDITATGTGAVTQSQGTAEFDTGATAGSTIQGEMREAPRYVSGDANYWMFMVRLPTPTGTGKAEIGPSDGTDGYLLRRTSTGVYFVHLKNGVETSVESANWNGREDDLFTRAGAVEAIDFAQANIYVITQLWFGSGPTTLWAIPPDANESGSGAIPLHTFRHPNEDPTASTTTPNLPLQANVENGDTAESLVLRSGSWATGNTAPRLLPIQSTANSTTTPPTVASPFTGKFVSTIHHPFLEVFLDCDVDGTLFVEFSHDASGVDSTEDFEYDAGDGVSIYPMETRLEFVRVRFEPATDAGSIDLRTGLKSIGGGTPVEKIRMPMTRNTDAVPSKSALFALDGNQTVAMPGTAAHGVDVDVTRLPTDANGRTPVTTHPAGEADVLAGEVFSAGNLVSLGSGQQGSIVIENPAGSGVDLWIRGIDCYLDVMTSLTIDIIQNPTVDGGTTLSPVNHDFGSATASQAVLTSGQGITSGGTVLHMDGRAVRDAPFRLRDAVFRIPEGVSLALRVTAPGGLSGGAVFEPNFSWREVDA